MNDDDRALMISQTWYVRDQGRGRLSIRFGNWRPADRLADLVRTNFGTWRGFVRLALAQIEFVFGRLSPHVELRSGHRINRLVFLCLGNINRSAFGEQLARRHGVRACSVGLSTTTGAPAFETAVRTAAEFGISLDNHCATDLADFKGQDGDLYVAMEIRHVRQLVASGVAPHCVVLLGNWARPRRFHLHDPHTLSDEYFRTCFTLIDSAVRGLVRELKATDTDCFDR